MNDSDDDLLSSAVDGLEEDEDWTDTTWAQPVLPAVSTQATSSSSSKPLAKVSTTAMPYRQGNSQSALGNSDMSNIGSSMRDVNGPEGKTDKHNLQLKSLTESVAASDTTLVNRMSLNDNKAGMEGLDKTKINKIIHEASKGSKFYENEKKKEEQMKRRIEEQNIKVGKITDEQLQQGLIEADQLLEEFECHRDLNHTIVHVDMDAFYAAVEMRDNPSLKDKPMAVGGTAMLSTSNYHARKFGVRAAMPGFIGKKLCPDLIIVPLNFEKYSAVSKEVRVIMSEYDPNFCPMSLDEAYLDMTKHLERRLCMSESERSFLCRDKAFVDSDDHCHCDLNEGEKKNKLLEQLSSEEKADSGHVILGSCEDCGLQFPPFTRVVFGRDDEEAVREMRTRIEQRTRLTASAGIAPNMMLAKVCSDKNKPNGQYKVPATREEVLHFIKDLSTRKISGIGKVSETMLNALGVYTCTDLYEKRALLYHLYSSISFNYFMRICLGIGSTTVERDSERKSISTERTFSEISKPADLYKKCEELCESLAEDLTEEQMKGKTVTIKLKTVRFEVKTRAHTLADYTDNKDKILQAARELLKIEIQACSPQPLRLRLMGVRMSSLLHQSQCKNQRQNTITGLLKKMSEKTRKHLTDQTPNDDDHETSSSSSVKITLVDGVPDIKAPDFLSRQNVAALQTHSKNELYIIMESAIHGLDTTEIEELTKLKEGREVNNVDSKQFTLSKAESDDKKLGEYQNCTTERNLKQLKLETDTEQMEQQKIENNSEQFDFETDKKIQHEQKTEKKSCKGSYQTLLEGSTEVQKQTAEVEIEELESFKNHIGKDSDSSKRCDNVHVSDDINNKNEAFKERKIEGENTLHTLHTESESKMHDTLVDDENTKIEVTKAEQLCDKLKFEDDAQQPIIYTPGRRTRSGIKMSKKNTESRKRRNSKHNSQTSLSAYVCPVCCQKMLFKDLNQFNEHIDDCMAEKDVNSNHFPAPAHAKPNQHSTMDKTIVKVEAENSELCCEESQIMVHAKASNIPDEVKSEENSTVDLKESFEENHIESNRDVNSEWIESSSKNSTTYLQFSLDDCETNTDQHDFSKDKDKISESETHLASEIVNEIYTMHSRDVNENLNQIKHINEKFGCDKEANILEGSGSVKIDKMPIEETQAKIINVSSSIDTGESDEVMSRMPSKCEQNSETLFDMENQCDVISSTNENDNINDERVAKKDHPILIEPDLPSLKPYISDLDRKTDVENNDNHTGSFEICIKETNNHDGVALVGSTNNNKPNICNKMLDESKVEKLIEQLIDKTISDESVEVDDSKGNKCKLFKTDTRQSELNLTSESNVTVHDLERPSGSKEYVLQEGDTHTGEYHTNEETVRQKEICEESTNEEDISLLVCPICNIEQRVSDLAAFNDHVDSCLSRGTISAILKEQRGDIGHKTNLKRGLPTSGQKSAKRQKTNIKMPSCRSIASFFQGK